MSEIHGLFDDHDAVAADLRRDLQALWVPFDPQRADDMVAAATAPGRRRAARLSAPLATAAAVLAVGAGVAVFALAGGSDSALPSGGAPPAGTPKPPASHAMVGPNPGYGVVECAAGGRLVGGAVRVHAVPSRAVPVRPRIAPRVRSLPRAPGQHVRIRLHPMPGTVTCVSAATPPAPRPRLVPLPPSASASPVR